MRSILAVETLLEKRSQFVAVGNAVAVCAIRLGIAAQERNNRRTS